MLPLMIITSLLSMSSLHGLHMSYFEIKPNGNETSLFVSLDKNDLLKAIGGDSEGFDNRIERYFEQHLKITFDGLEASFKLDKKGFNEAAIELQFTSNVNTNKVKFIKIYNNCLIDTNDGQENLVRFKYYDIQRTFRMNKDRVKTSLNYKDQ